VVVDLDDAADALSVRPAAPVPSQVSSSSLS
jgi:hypothetical protein